MTVVALIAVVVVCSVLGELMITHGMKKSGEIHDFRPRPFLGALGRAFRGGWLPGGVAASAVSFFAFMAVLSTADVSFVVPATAVTYVLNTLGARVLLREHVNATRWAGAALVTAGVALVSF
jgi:drug/metabolite transporter (DMT)-like permease